MTDFNDSTKITRSLFLKKIGLFTLGNALIIPFAHTETNDVPFRGDSLDAPTDYVQPAKETPFILRGPRGNPRIALTFDDGPTPGVTDKILKVLEQNRARATFFMIGNRIKQSPSLAREVRDQRHEVANHSYTHPVLSRLSKQTVHNELQKTQGTIEDMLQVQSRWFRPPYGAFNRSQTPIASELKLSVVIWSVDPRDWSRPGINVIHRRILSQTAGGDIVLCHDLHRQTAQAAPYIIPSLIDRGFELVTLSDLLLG